MQEAGRAGKLDTRNMRTSSVGRWEARITSNTWWSFQTLADDDWVPALVAVSEAVASPLSADGRFLCRMTNKATGGDPFLNHPTVGSHWHTTSL